MSHKRRLHPDVMTLNGELEYATAAVLSRTLKGAVAMERAFDIRIQLRRLQNKLQATLCSSELHDWI